jgi:hypothetical protein
MGRDEAVTKHPIPDEALDDRLAFVGTSGSGKTFAAKGCAETLLKMRHRVVIIDPLDVWFGLRLLRNGRDAAFPVAILGGRHGDLPLTEHAGATIGEAVARSTESCIVSLTGIKTSAGRQRFMLAFLDALYERTDPDARDPYHVIFDEADLWAPQKPMGNEAMLCHLMEEIVRRGRVKGFIPWLISQRPAVLNKNVLSQADGLVAFKLTSSQDRDAIGGWIEGQADRQQGKEILASLPRLERGSAVIWLPGRDILYERHFLENGTFDSSRTPKRGEKKHDTALTPLNLPALKERLATAEAETRANDPKALKARIAELESKSRRDMTVQPQIEYRPDPDSEKRGYSIGHADAANAANRAIAQFQQAWDEFAPRLERLRAAYGALVDTSENLRSVSPPPLLVRPGNAERKAIPPRAMLSAGASGNGSISPSLQKVLDAISWWRKIGVEPVERARASVVAGYSPKASTFGVYVAELVKLGLVEVTPGKVALTPAGLGCANAPTATTARELRQMARALLSSQEGAVFDAVYEAYPNEIRRADVAEAVGLSPTASTCGVYLAGVAAYGIIENAGRGAVRAADWLFP